MIAHLTMLPRLEAEESMRDAERVMIGSGVGSKESRRSVLRGWRQAAGPQRAAKADVRTARGIDALHAMGIQVVVHGR